jgi:hypothetical protein
MDQVQDVIENGVKRAQPMDEWVNSENIVGNVINDGVKEIIPSTFESEEQKDHWKTNDEITENINDAIENGVKETQPLPARDGNRDWGLYYQRQGNLTKPHTEYVKEVIEDSYNHRGRIEGVIRNTDKDGI